MELWAYHAAFDKLWKALLFTFRIRCCCSTFFTIYISFIGYGNIAPSTEWGKITTIFYAIIGMPLFLLYLSNIGNSSLKTIFHLSLLFNNANILIFYFAGDILAKSFKWIYAKCCLCRICPKIARRRMMRERKKLRMQTVDRDFPVN